MGRGDLIPPNYNEKIVKVPVIAMNFATRNIKGLYVPATSFFGWFCDVQPEMKLQIERISKDYLGIKQK